MKLGIKARDIMRKDFPIFSPMASLKNCMERLKKRNTEACMVLNNGIIYAILSNQDLLKYYLKSKEKERPIKEIEPRKNFAIVKAETDIVEIIKLMKKSQIDFIVVKDINSVGLITKQEISGINLEIFDRLYGSIKQKVCL